MCTGVILNSRINKVVFGAKNKNYMNFTSLLNKFNIKNSIDIIENILSKECSKLINDFFLSKR